MGWWDDFWASQIRVYSQLAQPIPITGHGAFLRLNLNAPAPIQLNRDSLCMSLQVQKVCLVD